LKPIFPKWMNSVPTMVFVVVHTGILLVIAGVWYYATPKFFEVGYMPTQPGSGFNHQIHAGKLGLDCRYCHSNVEKSWHANVPPVATCMGCHAENKLNVELASATDDKVQFIRDAYALDNPIQWRNIHVVPDYANFPHNAHINAGVSCFSCHGQIQSMPVVAQAKSLSMGWCLDCHRNPTENLVPKDKVTDLYWVQTEWFNRLDENGVLIPVPASERSHDGMSAQELTDTLLRNPPLHCAACHY
jgi:hypothetical protein